ncbi:phosphoribosylamine--glycine ligase [Pasteurella skyensis]|uniref:Phosphoribosylamine--glycine ligase n=1 Tax=Phocoenobacter skyensis TaxID=97481 RepID=A0AAJ6NCD6_9PAST|nr:phosphoribosylamine--glycine ligase [Pasteurella skyensis]MDP8169983.1 phosphoribosylamine--glycine ligase [Pasteurella skyensis]MDP8174081.1 phosphoribosylamine--glycine ligase [Pasteurella skyensis]
MKILIIGAGGREHAIAWKIAQNPRVTKIYAAVGNAYDTLLPNCENVNLTTSQEILTFAKEQQIDLTIVGSEELLVAGIVDLFQQNNLTIFGPDKKAAKLEGSKSFAKQFMQKYGVKTAKSQSFNDPKLALDYIKSMQYPLVIKASGLAAGKGVVICPTHTEAEQAIDDMMVKKVFANAGDTIVIEQFLEGVEVSILSVTDGKTILPFISAKDHKKIGEGETGLNTGGMGVVAPNPHYTPEVEQQFITDILQPTLKGLQQEKMDFAGVIFFGLMVCADGVYLLEYNMRFGDPETQAVLPLLESDLLELIQKSLDKQLESITLQWHNASTCCVVLTSEGYPVKYKKGNKISGIAESIEKKDCQIFFAGVQEKEHIYYTNGGRVLNIVGIASSLEQAKEKAYQNVTNITFRGMYYRNDIGQLLLDKRISGQDHTCKLTICSLFILFKRLNAKQKLFN